MKPLNVKAIEKKAKNIMLWDFKIWDKYGWNSGSDVDIIQLKNEVQKKVKGKLSILYYYIFEDANAHSLNNALLTSGKFKGKYGSPEAEAEWKEYQKGGGKTWQLT